MTALMGLRTRLALAGVALGIPGDCRDIDRLIPVVEAGVDLIVCDGSGDVDADVEFLGAMRQRWAGRPLLVGTSSSKVAAPSAADVVHLRRPGWRFWGYPQGHEWSLLGRHATEAAVVESPGDDFDYLVVPASGPQDPLLMSALAHHPPLTAAALPWFAQPDRLEDDDEGAGIAGLLGAGVRRIALPEGILECRDAPERITMIAEAVKGAWASDDRAADYRLSAFRL